MSNTIIYNGQEYGSTPIINPTGVGEFVGNNGEKNPTGSNNERFNDYSDQSGNQILSNSIYSSVFGSGNSLANGQYSIVGGHNNSVVGSTVQGNLVVGLQNTSNGGQYSIIGGSQNLIQGGTVHGDLIVGSENELSGSSILETLVSGSENTIQGSITYSIIAGKGNSISGNTIDGNAIFGKENTLQGSILDFNIIGGYSNTISGYSHYNIIGGCDNSITNTNGSLIVGSNNSISNANIYYNIVGGSYNYVGGDYNIIGGNSNILCPNSNYNLVIGTGQLSVDSSAYRNYLDFRTNAQAYQTFLNSHLQSNTGTIGIIAYVGGITDGLSNVKAGHNNAILERVVGHPTQGAAVFGTDNVTTGSDSFIIGDSNFNSGNYNFSGGRYNTIAGYSGTNTTKIDPNNISFYLIVADNVEENFVIGDQNLVLSAQRGFISGNANRSIKDYECQVGGQHNIAMFNYDVIINGNNNFAQRQAHSIISGQSNMTICSSDISTSNSNFIIGYENILLDSSNSIVTGQYAYLTNSDNSYIKSGRPYTTGTPSTPLTSYQRIGNTSDHFENLYTELSSNLLITLSETLDTRSTILTTIVGSQGATNESSGGIIVGAGYSHLEGTTIIDHTNEKIYRHSIDNGSFASHVEGGGNYLTDGSAYGHIEGSYNKLASSANSHIEGSNNLTQFGSINSHVEGTGNIAQSAVAGHIEGSSNTINSSPIAHIEGYTNQILSNSAYGHAEGNNNTIEASTNGHIEGSQNNITGSSGHGHIEGISNTISAGAQFAHLEGTQNTISNGSNGGHIEGTANIITNASQYGHIEGSNNLISNVSGNAHIEGTNNTIIDGALIDANHAEGSNNYIRKSHYAHAEGYKTSIGPWNSADEEEATPGGELYSEAVHTEGYGSKASGKAAHAQGLYTVANADAQASLGRYNILDSTPTYANSYGTYAVIVGNGTVTTTTRVAYDAEATYEVDDEVIYDGVIYKCITAISEAEEFDSTKWEALDIELINDQEVTRSNAATLSWNGYLDVAGGFSINGTPIATSTTPNANPNISDAYNDTSTYNIGDYCIYNNSLYKCNTAITIAESFDLTKWTPTTITDELLSIITRINTLETQLNGYSFASAMTQQDYDSLDPDYDANTIYPIIE